MAEHEVWIFFTSLDRDVGVFEGTSFHLEFILFARDLGIDVFRKTDQCYIYPG